MTDCYVWNSALYCVHGITDLNQSISVSTTKDLQLIAHLNLHRFPLLLTYAYIQFCLIQKRSLISLAVGSMFLSPETSEAAASL